MNNDSKAEFFLLSFIFNLATYFDVTEINCRVFLIQISISEHACFIWYFPFDTTCKIYSCGIFFLGASWINMGVIIYADPAADLNLNSIYTIKKYNGGN